MHFSVKQLNQLAVQALKAAKCAGEYIEQFDRTQLKTEFKVSGSSLSSQVVTEVDLHCQAMIIEQLQASCAEFDIALLSEENCTDIAVNAHDRLTKYYFWCIDPLDGTLPFIKGSNGYAVSVALVDRNGAPVLAAVFQPATSAAYHMQFDHQRKATLYKNGVVFKPSNKDKQLHFYCDQSFLSSKHYPAVIQQLTTLLPVIGVTALKVISGNGAVVNALLVLENAPACYIKLPKPEQGGGALWDFSATACISHAVNAWASDMHGLPLQLNQRDSYYMNKKGVMFASDTRLAEILLSALSKQL